MTVATTGWPDRLLALDDWESLPSDESHHVECSEGILVVAPKPFPRHQRAMVRLADSLDRQLDDSLAALADVEVMLAASPLTMRAPDVVVAIKDVLRRNPPHLDVADVRLVVEIVSQGSRRTDRVTKLSEYAEAGIGDYLIVDLDPTPVVEHYRLDDVGGYESQGVHTESATFSVAGAYVEIDVPELIG